MKKNSFGFDSFGSVCRSIGRSVDRCVYLAFSSLPRAFTKKKTKKNSIQINISYMTNAEKIRDFLLRAKEKLRVERADASASAHRHREHSKARPI